MISVCIPVGPYPSNKRWLDEALASVEQQSLRPEKVLLINDGASLDVSHVASATNVVYFPWRLGVSHAFNFGVMLAPTECVFMLGSDDTLEPTCLEQCWNAYLSHNKQGAYYYTPIRYMDTQEIQTVPCNAAMVTKGFWRMTGGFPIESAIGAGDSILLSICLKHNLPVYQVGNGEPLYAYRRHPDIYTYTHIGKLHPALNNIRDVLTADWTPPDWTRNF